MHLWQDHPLAHSLGDGSDDGPENMHYYQQQNPTHARLDDIPGEIARKEFPRLLTCGLHRQHQHGGCEGRLETLVAEHIHQCQTIEEDIEHTLDGSEK